MNKLLLNGDDELNNIVIGEDTYLTIDLENSIRNIDIIVEENVCLNVLEFGINTNNKLVFTLKENSRLLYNKASKNPNDYITVNLDGIYSNVVINSSIACCLDSNSTYYIRHNASNTSSKLSNHGVNFSNNELILKIDSYIPNSRKECITNQESKIINISSGKSNILPNLIIDNNDVMATHSAVISDFDKETMFYMKSRGINEEDSQKLLIRGFLIGNIEFEEEKTRQIEEILNI